MIEKNLSRKELVDLINNWIVGRNAYRNRQILIRRLCDGIPYERLAEEFGLSERQVKNIVYKCEDKLFIHAKDYGI